MRNFFPKQMVCHPKRETALILGPTCDSVNKESSPLPVLTQIPLKPCEERNIQEYCGPCKATPGLSQPLILLPPKLMPLE